MNIVFPLFAGKKGGTRAAKLDAMASAFASAAGAAAAVAFVSTVPLWYCLTCVVVLGLLAPFVFNFGLTQVSVALARCCVGVSRVCQLAFEAAHAVSLGVARTWFVTCLLAGQAIESV